MRPLETAPTFPADALHHALQRVPDAAWGQMSTLGQSGTHDGYRTLTLVQPGSRQPYADRFDMVLDAFAPVYQAWLSWLEPGGFILRHVDAGPYRERWQVPIHPGMFNGQAVVAGVAFRVRHWEPHDVTNPADRPRIHLVVDRDVVVDASNVEFHRVSEGS